VIQHTNPCMCYTSEQSKKYYCLCVSTVRSPLLARCGEEPLGGWANAAQSDVNKSLICRASRKADGRNPVPPTSFDYAIAFAHCSRDFGGCAAGSYPGLLPPSPASNMCNRFETLHRRRKGILRWICGKRHCYATE
jgi:hypothetical protein